MTVQDLTIPVLWTDEGEPYDAVTGELISTEDMESRGFRLAEIRSPYTFETLADVEMALDRRQSIESRIKSHKDRLAAITRNYNTMIRMEERKLEWWGRFNLGPITDLVRRALGDGKARSMTFAFGTVKFRRTQGTTKIIDMPRAVEYVRGIDPSKVRIEESVTATVVKALAEDDLDSLHFLAITPPGESVTIDCGLGDK